MSVKLPEPLNTLAWGLTAAMVAVGIVATVTLGPVVWESLQTEDLPPCPDTRFMDVATGLSGDPAPAAPRPAPTDCRP